MKIQSLKVKNIRSVKKLEIELPESAILFYGDIGSGKSSVLKAIEFALFGTLSSGNLSGTSLLRRGEKKASVELTFLVDEKSYTIYRELKQVVRKEKETVIAGDNWLIEEGVKESYATTDLRRKVLSILNYSVPRYERRNSIDIFRYTVYTPQEEIKAILQADSDERFEILKDVFEIEKYENTLANLVTVKKRLNVDLRDIDRDIKAIGAPEEDILGKEQEIADQTSKIEAKNSQILSKKKVLSEQKKKYDIIQQEFNEYSKKFTEINSKQEIIKSNRDTVFGNEQKLKNLKAEIKKKQKELHKIPEMGLPTDRSELELEEGMDHTQELMQEKIDQKGGISQTIENYDELLKAGKCPFCHQPIHDKKQFKEELKNAQQTLKSISKDIHKMEQEIANGKGLLKNLREYHTNEEKKNGLKEVIQEKQRRESDLTTSNKNSTKIMTLTEKEIENILKSYKIASLEEFRQVEQEIKRRREDQNKIVEESQSDLTRVEKEASTFEAELINLQAELKYLHEEKKRKEQLKESHAYMSSIRNWVDDQLPVLLKDIERTILTTTAIQFDHYFKQWFRELVEEENIDIEINPEDFQPIVRMNGYESPFADMSGGEKSALSLAYRLALNKVISTKHQEVKSKGLLILDEPTDGFSEQQVNKMQNVFEKLNIKQIIIISHERTLDSFVMDILNFKKINHKTTVSREHV